MKNRLERRHEIFELINKERQIQDLKHPGVEFHVDAASLVIDKIKGKLASAILSDDMETADRRLVEIAATCVRALESEFAQDEEEDDDDADPDEEDASGAEPDPLPPVTEAQLDQVLDSILAEAR